MTRGVAAALVAVVFMYGASAPAQTSARQARVGVLVGGVPPPAVRDFTGIEIIAQLR